MSSVESSQLISQIWWLFAIGATIKNLYITRNQKNKKQTNFIMSLNFCDMICKFCLFVLITGALWSFFISFSINTVNFKVKSLSDELFKCINLLLLYLLLSSYLPMAAVQTTGNAVHIFNIAYHSAWSAWFSMFDGRGWLWSFDCLYTYMYVNIFWHETIVIHCFTLIPCIILFYYRLSSRT